MPPRMAEIKSFTRLLIVLFLMTGCPINNLASASSCETVHKRIQPAVSTAEDGKEYQIINFPNFVQEAVTIECLPNQSCANGSCQQDYKLHQFMSVPAEKQQFELIELQFRLFNIPYGCKCSA